MSCSGWAAITQNAIKWMAHKQQAFISHSSGKSKFKVPAESVSGEDPFLIDGAFSLCLLVVEGLASS
jgi:hypothetical protein